MERQGGQDRRAVGTVGWKTGALVPRADVLASLAPQKTNVEGGDLKRPERGVGFVAFPNMVHVLAPGGLVRGTAKTMVQEEQTIRRWDGPEPVIGASGDWSG
jgi:hypothetical protein